MARKRTRQRRTKQRTRRRTKQRTRRRTVGTKPRRTNQRVKQRKTRRRTRRYGGSGYQSLVTVSGDRGSAASSREIGERENLIFVGDDENRDFREEQPAPGFRMVALPDDGDLVGRRGWRWLTSKRWKDRAHDYGVRIGQNWRNADFSPGHLASQERHHRPGPGR